MQAVALEIADDLAVEVDLVQVAEFVVVMLQVATGTLFGK